MNENGAIAGMFMMMLLALIGLLALVAICSGNMSIGTTEKDCKAPTTSTSDASANW